MIARVLVCAAVSLLLTHMAGATGAAVKTAVTGAHAHDAKDEPRPYDKKAKAWADVDAAFARARRSGKHVVLAMGANWCHDSRSLAAKFESPEFRTLIEDSFEVVYVDVGQKNRNIDIAQVYGIDEIVGTPTVLVLSPQGKLLNASTAPTWRNAASRSLDDALIYFRAYAGGPVLEAKP